jgi:hypothetical protein
MRTRSTFYRLLGMAVWKCCTFYLSQKYGSKLRSRKVAGLGGLLVLAAAAVLFSARRGDSAASD